MAKGACADAPFPAGMVEEIERFLKDDAQRPSGQDSYPEVFATRYFFPLQRRRELEAMIRIARGVDPKAVMEIGADKGGGFYHWLKCLPSVKTGIAVEIRGMPWRDAFAKAFPDKELLTPRGGSLDRTVMGAIRHNLGDRKIDVLFIDGDKNGFVKDFDAYLPLMAKGGVVFMHDVNDRPPAKAFEEIKTRGYRYDAIIDVSEADEAVTRESLGIAPSSEHEKWLRHWRGRSCGVGVICL